MKFFANIFYTILPTTIFTKSLILDIWLGSEYASDDGYQWQLHYYLPNILAIFQSIFTLSTATIPPGVVLDIFFRENSSASSSNSLLDVIFESAGSDLNNEAKAYISESERVKATQAQSHCQDVAKTS